MFRQICLPPYKLLAAQPRRGHVRRFHRYGLLRIGQLDQHLPGLLALNRLRRVGRAMGLDRDMLFRDRVAQLTCDVLDCGALYQRLGEDIIAGVPPGPEASVLKIVVTELEQRLTEALAEALGEDGTLTGRRDFGGVEADVVTPYLFGRCATIYGGTTEIQKNIIARRILGL